MNWIKYSFIGLCLLNPVACLANIVKIDSFQSLLPIKHDDGQDTLLLLDIDYVITAPKSHVLRPCGQKQITNFIKRFEDSPAMLEKIVNGLLFSRQEALIEANINDWIKTNQTRYQSILLLTSFPIREQVQDTQIEQRRLQQLEQMGFNVKLLSATGVQKSPELSLYHGIIFAKPKLKSQALDTYLKHQNLKPQRIILIDDRMDNLEDLQSYSHAHGIHFTGYWYQGADHLDCHLDQSLTTVQFQYLQKYNIWLEDDAVKPYCNAHPDPICQIAINKE